MYANGHGVTPDYVIAHMWFNLAASKGDQMATQFRDRVAQNMNQAQLAEAQKLAGGYNSSPGKNEDVVKPPDKKMSVAATSRRPPNKKSISAWQPQ